MEQIHMSNPANMASGSGMADLLPKSVSLVLLKSRYS